MELDGGSGAKVLRESPAWTKDIIALFHLSAFGKQTNKQKYLEVQVGI